LLNSCVVRHLPVSLLLGATVILAIACGGSSSAAVEDSTAGTSSAAVRDSTAGTSGSAGDTQADLDPISGVAQFFPGADPEEFDDGVVTFDEYDAAALRYRSCLEDIGVGVLMSLNEETSIYFISTSVDIEADEGAGSCYLTFGPVDAAWQLSVAAERDALGLSEMTQRLRRCLDEHNIPWTEDMHDGQLGVLVGQNGINRFNCERQ